jgi:pimeloyl-ACP methyl ester carboxylesterase
MLRPDRVSKLVVISVPHPLVLRTMRQHEMAWYQLFFQFTGIAEVTIQHDGWAWMRAFSRGDGDLDRWIEDLSRPGALTAALNSYRANLAPRMPGPPPELPLVKAPTLGIWSAGDHYLEGQRMQESGGYVEGRGGMSKSRTRPQRQKRKFTPRAPMNKHTDSCSRASIIGLLVTLRDLPRWGAGASSGGDDR